MKYHGLLIGSLLSLLAVTAFSNALTTPSSARIQGIVLDQNSEPIVGASVMISRFDLPVAGTTSDLAGRFSITVPLPAEDLQLKITSVGFAEYRSKISREDMDKPLTIQCATSTVEVSPITVTPSPDQRQMKISVPSSKVIALSSHSLVVTNPTEAVQSPQIAKIGSAHSSQIRINGTSPVYHLNGIPIGTDPNHFGMFSVVPATIVDRIEFSPQGTDASFGQPSVIDFKTSSSFEERSSTELNLSTLEFTGTMRKSGARGYVIGAARKSILDQLANSLDIQSERATIPPTSFGDVFLSTGLKLSTRWRLGLDQYHVSDYLSFNTAGKSAASSSVQTFQRAREHFVGLRAIGLYGNALLTGTLAVRDGRRSYNATPTADSKSGAVQIDLSDRSTSWLGQAGIEAEIGATRVKLGSRIDYRPNREATLRQQNWNMLPPFNTSDNPFIYQRAMNELYGNYSDKLTQQTVSHYLSMGRDIGRLSITAGLRAESFGHLAGDALLGRMMVSLKTSERSSATLFYGGFAEDPVTNILEPYQVMIRNDARDLRPIETKLLALDYRNGPATLSLFHKEISDLPVVSPDFAMPMVGSSLNPAFLRMRSDGTARFVGGSLELELPKFISPRLSFYGSYGYTDANRTDHGVTYPYESSAKHKVRTRFEYTLSRKITIGSEMMLRSGYPYSPSRQVLYYSEQSNYTETYYQSMLQQENSLSFKPNGALNLYATFSLGAATLSLAVTNATNRYNPIISSPSGYVYDAGILPSVGLRWQL